MDCCVEKRDKLIVGTAQLGMNYGIQDNITILDDFQKDVFLSSIWESGERWLDTAEGYGIAEKRIGAWHIKNPGKEFNICTKIAGLDHSTRNAFFESTKQHVKQCCDRLKVQKIGILLWHDANEYLENKSACEEAMCELQADGLIIRWGVSAYPYHNISSMLCSGMDVIQLPMNILDSRLIRCGIVNDLAKSGIEIHARSVFLQGLLTKPCLSANNKLAFCQNALSAFQAVCRRYGRTQEQMAIDYLQSISGISRMIIGFHNISQYKEVRCLINSAQHLNENDVIDIQNLFIDIDERIITPTMW